MEPRPILRKNIGLIIRNDIIRETEGLSRSPSYERGGLLSPYYDKSPLHSPSYQHRNTSSPSPRDLLSSSYERTHTRSSSSRDFLSPSYERTHVTSPSSRDFHSSSYERTRARSPMTGRDFLSPSYEHTHVTSPSSRNFHSSSYERIRARSPSTGRDFLSPSFERTRARSPSTGRDFQSSNYERTRARSPSTGRDFQSSSYERTRARSPNTGRDFLSPSFERTRARSPSTGRDFPSPSYERTHVTSPSSRDFQSSSYERTHARSPSTGRDFQSSSYERTRARSPSTGRDFQSSSYERTRAISPSTGRDFQSSSYERTRARSPSTERDFLSPSYKRTHVTSPSLRDLNYTDPLSLSHTYTGSSNLGGRLYSHQELSTLRRESRPKSPGNSHGSSFKYEEETVSSSRLGRSSEKRSSIGSSLSYHKEDRVLSDQSEQREFTSHSPLCGSPYSFKEEDLLSPGEKHRGSSSSSSQEKSGRRAYNFLPIHEHSSLSREHISSPTEIHTDIKSTSVRDSTELSHQEREFLLISKEQSYLKSFIGPSQDSSDPGQSIENPNIPTQPQTSSSTTPTLLIDNEKVTEEKFSELHCSIKDSSQTLSMILSTNEKQYFQNEKTKLKSSKSNESNEDDEKMFLDVQGEPLMFQATGGAVIKSGNRTFSVMMSQPRRVSMDRSVLERRLSSSSESSLVCRDLYVPNSTVGVSSPASNDMKAIMVKETQSVGEVSSISDDSKSVFKDIDGEEKPNSPSSSLETSNGSAGISTTEVVGLKMNSESLEIDKEGSRKCERDERINVSSTEIVDTSEEDFGRRSEIDVNLEPADTNQGKEDGKTEYSVSATNKKAEETASGTNEERRGRSGKREGRGQSRRLTSDQEERKDRRSRSRTPVRFLLVSNKLETSGSQESHRCTKDHTCSAGGDMVTEKREETELSTKSRKKQHGRDDEGKKSSEQSRGMAPGEKVEPDTSSAEKVNNTLKQKQNRTDLTSPSSSSSKSKQLETNTDPERAHQSVSSGGVDVSGKMQWDTQRSGGADHVKSDQQEIKMSTKQKIRNLDKRSETGEKYRGKYTEEKTQGSDCKVITLTLKPFVQDGNKMDEKEKMNERKLQNFIKESMKSADFSGKESLVVQDLKVSGKDPKLETKTVSPQKDVPSDENIKTYSIPAIEIQQDIVSTNTETDASPDGRSDNHSNFGFNRDRLFAKLDPKAYKMEIKRRKSSSSPDSTTKSPDVFTSEDKTVPFDYPTEYSANSKDPLINVTHVTAEKNGDGESITPKETRAVDLPAQPLPHENTMIKSKPGSSQSHAPGKVEAKMEKDSRNQSKLKETRIGKEMSIATSIQEQEMNKPDSNAAGLKKSRDSNGDQIGSHKLVQEKSGVMNRETVSEGSDMKSKILSNTGDNQKELQKVDQPNMSFKDMIRKTRSRLHGVSDDPGTEQQSNSASKPQELKAKKETLENKVSPKNVRKRSEAEVTSNRTDDSVHKISQNEVTCVKADNAATSDKTDNTAKKRSEAEATSSKTDSTVNMRSEVTSSKTDSTVNKSTVKKRSEVANASDKTESSINKRSEVSSGKSDNTVNKMSEVTSDKTSGKIGSTVNKRSEVEATSHKTDSTVNKTSKVAATSGKQDSTVNNRSEVTSGKTDSTVDKRSKVKATTAKTDMMPRSLETKVDDVKKTSSPKNNKINVEEVSESASKRNDEMPSTVMSGIRLRTTENDEMPSTDLSGIRLRTTEGSMLRTLDKNATPGSSLVNTRNVETKVKPIGMNNRTPSIKSPPLEKRDVKVPLVETEREARQSDRQINMQISKGTPPMTDKVQTKISSQTENTESKLHCSKSTAVTNEQSLNTASKDPNKPYTRKTQREEQTTAVTNVQSLNTISSKPGTRKTQREEQTTAVTNVQSLNTISSKPGTRKTQREEQTTAVTNVQSLNTISNKPYTRKTQREEQTTAVTNVQSLNTKDPNKPYTREEQTTEEINQQETNTNNNWRENKTQEIGTGKPTRLVEKSSDVTADTKTKKVEMNSVESNKLGETTTAGQKTVVTEKTSLREVNSAADVGNKDKGKLAVSVDDKTMLNMKENLKQAKEKLHTRTMDKTSKSDQIEKKSTETTRTTDKTSKLDHIEKNSTESTRDTDKTTKSDQIEKKLTESTRTMDKTSKSDQIRKNSTETKLKGDDVKPVVLKQNSDFADILPTDSKEPKCFSPNSPPIDRREEVEKTEEKPNITTDKKSRTQKPINDVSNDVEKVSFKNLIGSMKTKLKNRPKDTMVAVTGKDSKEVLGMKKEIGGTSTEIQNRGHQSSDENNAAGTGVVKNKVNTNEGRLTPDVEKTTSEDRADKTQKKLILEKEKETKDTQVLSVNKDDRITKIQPTVKHDIEVLPDDKDHTHSNKLLSHKVDKKADGKESSLKKRDKVSADDKGNDLSSNLVDKEEAANEEQPKWKKMVKKVIETGKSKEAESNVSFKEIISKTRDKLQKPPQVTEKAQSEEGQGIRDMSTDKTVNRKSDTEAVMSSKPNDSSVSINSNKSIHSISGRQNIESNNLKSDSEIPNKHSDVRNKKAVGQGEQKGVSFKTDDLDTEKVKLISNTSNTSNRNSEENSRSLKSAADNVQDKQISAVSIKQHREESKNRLHRDRTTDGKTIVPDIGNMKSSSSADVNVGSQTADDKVHITHNTELSASKSKLVNQGKKSNEICQGIQSVDSHRKKQFDAKSTAEVTRVTEPLCNLDRKNESSKDNAKLRITSRVADNNTELKKSGKELGDGDRSDSALDEKYVNNKKIKPDEKDSCVDFQQEISSVNRRDYKKSTGIVHRSKDDSITKTKTDVSVESPGTKDSKTVTTNNAPKKKTKILREFIVINDIQPVSGVDTLQPLGDSKTLQTGKVEKKMKDKSETNRENTTVITKSVKDVVKENSEMKSKEGGNTNSQLMLNEVDNSNGQDSLSELENGCTFISRQHDSKKKDENKEDDMNVGKKDLLQTTGRGRHKFELPALKSAKVKSDPITSEKVRTENEKVHEDLKEDDIGVMRKDVKSRQKGTDSRKAEAEVLSENTKTEKKQVPSEDLKSRSALKVRFDTEKKYLTEHELNGNYVTKHSKDSHTDVSKDAHTGKEGKHPGGSPKQSRKKSGSSSPNDQDLPKKVHFKNVIDVDKDYQRKVYAQEVAKKIQTSIIAEMRNKLRSKASAMEKHQERMKTKQTKTQESQSEGAAPLMKTQLEESTKTKTKAHEGLSALTAQSMKGHLGVKEVESTKTKTKAHEGLSALTAQSMKGHLGVKEEESTKTKTKAHEGLSALTAQSMKGHLGVKEEESTKTKTKAQEGLSTTTAQLTKSQSGVKQESTKMNTKTQESPPDSKAQSTKGHLGVKDESTKTRTKVQESPSATTAQLTKGHLGVKQEESTKTRTKAWEGPQDSKAQLTKSQTEVKETVQISKHKPGLIIDIPKQSQDSKKISHKVFGSTEEKSEQGVPSTFQTSEKSSLIAQNMKNKIPISEGEKELFAESKTKESVKPEQMSLAVTTKQKDDGRQSEDKKLKDWGGEQGVMSSPTHASKDNRGLSEDVERGDLQKSDQGFFDVSKYITNTKIKEFKKELFSTNENHSEREKKLNEKDIQISKGVDSKQKEAIQFVSTSFSGPESPTSPASSKSDQKSPEFTYQRFDFDESSESKSHSSDSTVKADRGSDDEEEVRRNEDIVAELRRLLPLEIFSTHRRRRKHAAEEAVDEDDDSQCDCSECQGSSDEEYSVDGRIPQLSVIGEEDEETVSVFDPDKTDSEEMEFHRKFMEKVYQRNPRSSKVFNPGVVVSGSESDESEEDEDDSSDSVFESKRKPLFDIQAFLKYTGNVEDWLERIEDFVPMTREPSKAYEYKVFEQDYSVPSRSYIDHLTTYIPPRLPIEKPELYTISPESVTLTWKRARVPDKIRDTCNLTYTVEVRNPPNLDWRELVTGLTTINTDLKGLHPRLDYLFRVRAWNEYGCSEPSLPVSLHRPVELSDEYDSGEDWDEQYRVTLGDLDTPIDEAPPKLPMETPRITDSGESAMLSWFPARIPAYAKKTPITYIIEIKEPHVPGWSRLSSGISDTNYFIEGLRPTQDYQFRVKAETQYGVSDPTLPVSLDRPKEVGKKCEFLPALEYYEIFKKDWNDPSDKNKRSSVDLLREDIDLPIKRESPSTGVPPRMSSSRPLISQQLPDRLNMSWLPARVPSYVKNQKLTYIVEVREPPSTLWRNLADDLRDTEFDVRDLSPSQDYLFRVRAKNEYGLSEPTMPASVIRERDDYVPHISSRSGSFDSGSPWVRSRASSVESYRKQKSFDFTDDESDIYINREKKAGPPEFKSSNEDVHYGVEGSSCKVTLGVKGYPLPTTSWFFMGAEVDYGNNFKAHISPSGNASLEIHKLTRELIGEYKCTAENEHGTATKIIRLELADQPTVLDPVFDLTLDSHQSGKLVCRVDGLPYPTVKFLKDSRSLAGSSRLRVDYNPPDTWTLTLDKVITTDSGMYTCVAENLAGKATCSAKVTVEENEDGLIERDLMVKPLPYREAFVEDYYHVLEEIGRGRHGVVRRVLDKFTGSQYAAKFIHVCDEHQKQFFRTEVNMLRWLNQRGVPKVVDTFITERRIVIITEIVTNYDIIERLLQDPAPTEGMVAAHMKQLLLVIKELHKASVVHLDIKPSNIRFNTSNDLMLIDFGFSERLHHNKETLKNYGSAGFCSPEQIHNEPVTEASDVWAIGATIYTLLTGSSPFHGSTEQEVLQSTTQYKWKEVDGLSPDAKDFLSKILIRDPKERMTVDGCLSHPWIKNAEAQGGVISREGLTDYLSQDRLRRTSSATRGPVRLQSLLSVLDGKQELGIDIGKDSTTGELSFPDSGLYGEYLDQESWFDWQSRYYYGLDADDSEAESESACVDPVLRKEREWIQMAEDQKLQLQRPQDFFPKEEELEDNPQFTIKLHDTYYKPGDVITLSCHVTSSSTVNVTWFQNEELIADSKRMKTSLTEGGIASLVITSAKPYDDGIYKCIARNKTGKSSTYARVMVGETPSQPRRPVISQVSSCDVLLLWEAPENDGNSDITNYRVDYRQSGSERWCVGAYSIDECAIVTGLLPDTSYRFRVSCTNKLGKSSYSVSSVLITTKPTGSTDITLDPFTISLLSRQHEGLSFYQPPKSALSPEDVRTGEITLQTTNVEDLYSLSNVLWRGKYSSYVRSTDKSKKNPYIAKITTCSDSNKDSLSRELEFLRTMRHERFVRLCGAYLYLDRHYWIMEYLSGVNVVEHFSYKSKYTEDMVATVIRQVLDGLQFLHYHGYTHLNIQPSSVMMVNRRRLDIRIVDFSLVQKVTKEGQVVPREGNAEFMAPEVVVKDTTSYPADIWAVGVLAFLLLSGESPYKGQDEETTFTNIAYNRYNALSLYENITKEALKFIFRVLKRISRNRMTADECLEDKWLQTSETMIKFRTDAVFSPVKLRNYVTESFLEALKVSEAELQRLREKFLIKQEVKDEQKPLPAKEETRDTEEPTDIDGSQTLTQDVKEPEVKESTSFEEIADDIVNEAIDEALKSS